MVLVGLTKVFLHVFCHSLPKRCVTRIRLFLLDKLVKVYVKVLFIVKLPVYEYDMPCVLGEQIIAKINEALKSCPSTSKKLYLR